MGAIENDHPGFLFLLYGAKKGKCKRSDPHNITLHCIGGGFVFFIFKGTYNGKKDPWNNIGSCCDISVVRIRGGMINYG